MKILFTYIICFSTLGTSWGQNLPERGVPRIQNYTPQEYGTTAKIWDIGSSEEGVLYFASDNGVLEYDGSIWKKYEGSKGSTRSIYIVSDSTILSGSDLDFGTWNRGENFQLDYTSLYPFKENAGKITEEFWNVHIINGLRVYVSFDNIYIDQDNHLTKISAPTKFYGSYAVGNKIYFADEQLGIYNFDGISLALKIKYPTNKNIRIKGISQIGDKLIVVTQSQGIFIEEDGSLEPWQGEVNKYLSRDQVFCFSNIGKNYFAFGTILNGIYIMDKGGKIVQHINKKKGLANNTILDIYYSKVGVLWASMDYGVASIHLEENLTYIKDLETDFGTGQTALLQGDDFYLGTNQGLYSSKWNNLKNGVGDISFSLIKNSEGQVWDLKLMKDAVIVGHDKGLFVLEDNQLRKLEGSSGILNILPLDNVHFLVGTYNGIQLYKKQGNEYNYVHDLKLIKGACRQLELDGNNKLWVHIPNYGIISANLDDSYIVNEQTIYLEEELEEKPLYLIKESKDVAIVTARGKIIYDRNNSSLLTELKNTKFSNVKDKVAMHQKPIFISDSMRFYSVNNGFAISNDNAVQNKKSTDNLLLRALRVFSKDSSYTLNPSDHIPYEFHNVKMIFLIPHKENCTYRYYVKNYSDKWSDWSYETELELLNLKEGDYEIKVEARTDNNIIIKKEISLVVDAPFYRTSIAFLMYLLLGGVFLLSLLAVIKKKKLKEEKDRITKNELISRIKESESRRKNWQKKNKELLIEKDQLEKELKTYKINSIKSSEANNRTIKSLTSKLDELKKAGSLRNKDLKELSAILKNHNSTDQNSFQIQMDNLNQEYIKKLKKLFPALTMYDLRLCTYIRTGLSTREIAQLMNVLPSSINVSRSRLRKKLGLSIKEDLYSFLEKIVI